MRLLLDNQERNRRQNEKEEGRAEMSDYEYKLLAFCICILLFVAFLGYGGGYLAGYYTAKRELTEKPRIKKEENNNDT